MANITLLQTCLPVILEQIVLIVLPVSTQLVEFAAEVEFVHLAMAKEANSLILALIQVETPRVGLIVHLVKVMENVLTVTEQEDNDNCLPKNLNKQYMPSYVGNYLTQGDKH